MAPPSHNSFFYHHIALTSVHEQCEHKRREEEYDVYDTEGEACLEHRTRFVDIQCQWRVRTPSYVPERPEGKVE